MIIESRSPGDPSWILQQEDTDPVSGNMRKYKFKVCLKILTNVQTSEYNIHDYSFKMENDSGSSISQNSLKLRLIRSWQ